MQLISEHRNRLYCKICEKRTPQYDVGMLPTFRCSLCGEYNLDKDLDCAYLFTPQDSICAFCGKKNDFADDIGFFYIVDMRGGEVRNEKGSLTNEMKPACRSCYFEEPGQTHRKYYGIGER